MVKFHICIDNKNDVQENLRWHLDNREVTDNGAVQGELSFESIAALETIKRSITVDPPMPAYTMARVVRLSVSRWVKENKTRASSEFNLLESFERVFRAELATLAAKKIRYTVVTFLNIAQRHIKGLGPLIVQGYELRFPSWRALGHQKAEDLFKLVYYNSLVIDKKPAILDYRPEDNVNYWVRKHDFSPVSIEVETFSVDAAVSIAENRLNLWRAALNLSFYPINLIGQPTVCRFLPSPVCAVFDQDGKLVPNLFYPVKHYDYQTQDITQENIRAAIKTIENFNKAKPGSLAEFAVDLVRMYQEALDCTDYSTAYLALWQALEALTLNKPGKSTQVDKRLATLLNPNPRFRSALTVLVSSRNKLVHSGFFPDEGEELVRILAIFVYDSICKLFDLSKSLSDKDELEFYYRYASLGNTDLTRERKLNTKYSTAKRKVLNFILNQRKK